MSLTRKTNSRTQTVSKRLGAREVATPPWTNLLHPGAIADHYLGYEFDTQAIQNICNREHSHL